MTGQENTGLCLQTDGVYLCLRMGQTHLIRHRLREQVLGGDLLLCSYAVDRFILQHRVCLTVTAGKITVHRVSVPIRCDTGHQRRRRLITSIDQMRIGDRRLEGLFT